MSRATPSSPTTRLGLALVACATSLASGAHAQEPPSPNLPTPLAFVSGTDFECRRANGQPPAPNVFIRQLNPVLKDKLPNQVATLGDLVDVCVPVAKNGQLPPPNALAITRWIDLACYAAEAPPVDQEVKLSHLNPQLKHLPDEAVKLVQLRELCVPVVKNNTPPPPAVRHIVRHFDVACYELDEPTELVDHTLTLHHLNPVIQGLGLPPRTVQMKRSKRLCVPVGKNQQPIPPAVLPYIEWADFLKYRVENVGPPVPFLPLSLRHLNPLYDDRPAFPVVLEPQPLKLMVPVAKNGQTPPAGPGSP